MWQCNIYTPKYTLIYWDKFLRGLIIASNIFGAFCVEFLNWGISGKNAFTFGNRSLFFSFFNVCTVSFNKQTQGQNMQNLFGKIDKKDKSKKNEEVIDMQVQIKPTTKPERIIID